MVSLTLIADPFPDWEADVQAAAARDLAAAVATVAPRSCSARFLLAKGTQPPASDSPRLAIEQLGMKASMLPLVWQSGTTARPLDGEFVHALTPMVPLRSRHDDDGSQTSVTVSHSVAWDAPELLGHPQARLYRSFTKRAVKHADAILAPSHATARVLQEHYGDDLPVQVMQLAPPSEFLCPPDHIERRSTLELPQHYAVTTARPGDSGRLEWVFDALRAQPELPHVLVISGLDPAPPTRERDAVPLTVPEDLAARVTVIQPRDLRDIGAILAGASLLLQPQAFLGTGYLILGALAAAVPVLHAGHPAAAELSLDAGVTAETADEFGAALSELYGSAGSLSRLAVLADDRSRSFSWNSAAWQLWETHANL